MSLFFYHLALAWRSLRRDAGLSVAILVGMTMATSMWTITSAHYVRILGPYARYSPSLHQVELPHPQAAHVGPEGSLPGSYGDRLRVTFSEAEVLAGSGRPLEQTATFRSHLLVSAPGRAPRVANVRFVNAAFFTLFQRPFREGRAWTREEEAGGQAVAVLGLQASAALSGGPLEVEGRPFRVTGVLAQDQPTRVEWDLNGVGLDQDAVYLPYPAARSLVARPEFPIYQSAVGPRYEDLLRSDAIFVSHWVSLPDAPSVAAYRAYLDGKFTHYQLRSLAEWRAAFPPFDGGIRFFASLTFLLLLGGAFNMARLLLAKGLARTEEIGIHRALGAPRRALFLRHMLEAALLALPAAVLGQLASLPYMTVWNAFVRDTDVPLWLTAPGFLMGVLPAAAIGVLGGVYPAWRLSGVQPTVSMARR